MIRFAIISGAAVLLVTSVLTGPSPAAAAEATDDVCALLASPKGKLLSWPNVAELRRQCGLDESRPRIRPSTPQPPFAPLGPPPPEQVPLERHLVPRGAILGNPRVNAPDLLIDAMGHQDGHGEGPETQSETTVAVSDDAVCAAWNDDAFRVCAGGYKDGADCVTTGECRRCTNTAANCVANGDCGSCVGGPAAGTSCVIGAHSRCAEPIEIEEEGDCEDEDDSSICVGGPNDGAPCSRASECPMGTCGRVCVGGANDGDPCIRDSQCPGGTCGSLEPVCRRCVGGANDGVACLLDSECPGGACGRTCVGGANDGADCTDDSECPGGDCAGGRCARTCVGGANDGEPCSSNSECPGGFCPGCERTCIGGANDDGPCVEDSECPGGRCDAGACEGQNTGFGRSPTGLQLGTWTDQGSVFDPTTAGKLRSHGDPVLAVDNGGLFYLVHMADTNGDSSIDTIRVEVSSDQCETFPDPAAGVSASGAPTENLDKPWIAVDRSGGATDGRVYVCWWDANDDEILLSASPAGPPLAFGAPVVVARPHPGTCQGGTNDGGACDNDSACPGGGECDRFVQDCQVAVGPCGTVHVTWTEFLLDDSPPTIYYRSLAPELDVCIGGPNDGVTCTEASECPAGTCGFGAAEVVRDLAERPGGVDDNFCSGRQVIPAGLGPDIANIRNRESSTLAVNPVTGVPYVAWNEGDGARACVGGTNDGAACDETSECPEGVCAADSNVHFSQRASCAGGANDGEGCATNDDCPGGACGDDWSDSVIVHPLPADQFMPAMTVSPLGVIKIEYYDRAGHDPDIALSDAVSLDGKAWVNEQVSTVPFGLDRFTPARGRADLAGCYMGDYNGITADDLGFYHVWGDNRDAQSNPPHDGFLCSGGPNDGEGCRADSECPSGACIANCIGGANDGELCAAQSECPGGVCGHLDPNVYFDFQPTLRHFECDEVERIPFTRITGVSLEDQFGPSTVDVIRPKRLCNPTNKNDEDPLAPLDDDHLTGFIIKQRTPRFSRIFDQVVQNQFGTITFDIVRPDYLKVPSAKSPFGPPSPLLDPRIPHYKCYKVAAARTRVAGIQLQDQFGTFLFDVKKPVRLCVAADKNHEGITDPPVPMMCYKVRPTSGFPTFVGPLDPVYVDNQFGPMSFEVNHVRELCVPSTLNPEFPQCTE